MNNIKRKVTDLAPDLDISDIRVTVNGNETEIVSLQKYYETGNAGMMPSYLVQVGKSGLYSSGKQTFMLEYQKETEIGGTMVMRKGMGYHQCYFNFFGVSYYY